jgi:hypothetical protein
MATTQVQVADICNYGRFMLNDSPILRYMKKIWSDKETLLWGRSGCMILVSVKYITRHDVAKHMQREMFLTKNVVRV